MKKWVFNTCLIIFILVFVVSATYLAIYFINSGKAAKSYTNLQQQKQEAATTPRPTVSQEGVLVLPEEPPELVEVTHPVTGETIPVLQDYKDLFLQNPDMVGWITIPGTNIDYPVMQTPDSPNYYLKRNFEKESSSHGCLYAQENCDVFTPGDNVIIYGHRMKDRTMFAQLDQYEKKDFWQKNPYIYFDTIQEIHAYKIVSVFITTATEGEGFPYHDYTSLENEEDFDDFVRFCKGYELYRTGEEITPDDKLITLSTCTYTRINGRLVVVAKRVA